MKKIFCIFLAFVFFSCDNSLDINDEWKDIPVIYGILNPGTDEPNSESGANENHYVRVQKSFLGPQSANNYVNIYDSIYYNESDLNVWLDIINDEGEVDGPYFLEFISHDNLEEIELSKEDGLFHSENHHLYKIPYIARNLTNAAEDDDIYRINVLNINTGDTAFAETNIVEPITMSRPQPTGPQSFLFASVSSQATATQPIETVTSPQISYTTPTETNVSNTTTPSQTTTSTTPQTGTTDTSSQQTSGQSDPPSSDNNSGNSGSSGSGGGYSGY